MRGISLMHNIPEVAQICTNMADLFRYSIKGAFLVPLESELNIIDKYLYMIEVRFQGRITYKLEVSDDTKDCLIPKMILQPIVENSIFHGLDEIEEGGIIIIKTTRTEDDLYITVTDNGIGFSEEALQNLTRKLGEEITFISNSPSGTSDNIGVKENNFDFLRRLFGSICINRNGLFIVSCKSNCIFFHWIIPRFHS